MELPRSGNLSEVPKLKYLVRYYKPNALFLSETLVPSNKQMLFVLYLGLIIVLLSSNGRSGGLALL